VAVQPRRQLHHWRRPARRRRLHRPLALRQLVAPPPRK
jgi:hypothetical protein